MNFRAARLNFRAARLGVEFWGSLQNGVYLTNPAEFYIPCLDRARYVLCSSSYLDTTTSGGNRVLWRLVDILRV